MIGSWWDLGAYRCNTYDSYTKRGKRSILYVLPETVKHQPEIDCGNLSLYIVITGHSLKKERERVKKNTHKQKIKMEY